MEEDDDTDVLDVMEEEGEREDVIVSVTDRDRLCDKDAEGVADTLGVIEEEGEGETVIVSEGL